MSQCVAVLIQRELSPDLISAEENGGNEKGCGIESSERLLCGTAPNIRVQTCQANGIFAMNEESFREGKAIW